MNYRILLDVYRCILGTLISLALITQISAYINANAFEPINFFSYFTVLSNVISAMVLILSIKTNNSFLRGASTLYMIITGLGFSILLGGQNDEYVPWVNSVLHFIAPLGVTIEWIISPVKEIVKIKTAFKWMYFPIIYLIYSLVRGFVTGWYPYSFLNYQQVGVEITVLYLAVVISGVIIGVLFLVKAEGLLVKKFERPSGVYKK